MNTITKYTIRVWIALMSIFAFTVGWISLAQADAQRTEAASAVEPLRVFEFSPIPTIEELTQNQGPISSVPALSFTTPRLRTRGS